jgi:hypothetical protein
VPNISDLRDICDLGRERFCDELPKSTIRCGYDSYVIAPPRTDLPHLIETRR